MRSLTVKPILRRSFDALEERPWAVVVLAGGATVAAAVVLAASAGWPNVFRALSSRDVWPWFALCLASELVAYGGYALTIRAVARVDDGPEIDMRVSAETVVAGFGVFAATRGSGGFAVDYWAFRRAGASRRDAVNRVLALGFLEYTTLSVAALAASAALYWRWDGHAGLAATLPSLTVVPCVAAALWLTSPKRAERLSHAGRNAGWWRRTFASSVAGARNLRTLLLSPREHGLGVLGSFLYWSGDLLCLWAALQLVRGPRLTIAALVLAYTGGYVLTRRSLPAGGAGVVEVALTLALVGMGLHMGPALIAVLVYRLFNFWLPIVPALALMPTIRQMRSRFQKAEQSR